MRWLLVSTNPAPHLPNTTHPDGAGWNIGDVFARIGTEQVIRDVDPSATFDILNMDSHDSITTERPFDRCVLAGRPLFWKDCESHHLWTHVLQGWASRGKKKPLALGVGGCYALPRDEEAFDQSIRNARALCHAVSLRDKANEPAALLSVCPASWTLLNRPERLSRKLCNFMVWGGHYPGMADNEQRHWRQCVEEYAFALMDLGFEFVAHTTQEVKVARMLGFPADAVIYSECIDDYLTAYASASHYFGNRMHGAVVLAGRRAKIMAVGYDSRLSMVHRVWGDGRLPSELSVSDVMAFARSEPGEPEARRTLMVMGQRERMRKLVEDFAR